jgi:HEAT repeat protein
MRNVVAAGAFMLCALIGAGAPRADDLPSAEAQAQALREQLRSRDVQTRLNAVRALGRLAIPQDLPVAYEALAEALADKNARVRAQAARELREAQFGGPSVVRGLIRAIADSDRDVRLESIQAIRGRRASATGAIPQLEKALQDGDTAVRNEAAYCLALFGERGKPAVPCLRRLLVVPGGDRTKAKDVAQAANALRNFGPVAKSATPELLLVLRTEGDLFTLAQITRALAAVAPGDSRAVQALIAQVNAAPARRRAFAAQALGLMGPAAKDAVPALVHLLKSPGKRDPEPGAATTARAEAAGALGKMGAEGRRAVPALVAVIKDEQADFTLQNQCILALGLIGPAAAEATPALLEILLDPQNGHGSFARVAFEKVGRGTVPYVIPVLEKGEDVTRLRCLDLLGSLDRGTLLHLLPTLKRLSRDKNREIASRAARSVRFLSK